MLKGYEKLREFIVTQHPSMETKDAFWSMLWDHNAQTVVLLTPVDTQGYMQLIYKEGQIKNDDDKRRHTECCSYPTCVVSQVGLGRVGFSVAFGAHKGHQASQSVCL